MQQLLGDTMIQMKKPGDRTLCAVPWLVHPDNQSSAQPNLYVMP